MIEIAVFAIVLAAVFALKAVSVRRQHAAIVAGAQGFAWLRPQAHARTMAAQWPQDAAEVLEEQLVPNAYRGAGRASA